HDMSRVHYVQTRNRSRHRRQSLGIVKSRQPEDVLLAGDSEAKNILASKMRIHSKQSIHEHLLEFGVRQKKRRIVGCGVLREINERITSEVLSVDERRHLDYRGKWNPAIGYVRDVESCQRLLQQQRSTNDALILNSVQQTGLRSG